VNYGKRRLELSRRAKTVWRGAVFRAALSTCYMNEFGGLSFIAGEAPINSLMIPATLNKPRCELMKPMLSAEIVRICPNSCKKTQRTKRAM
jgi:hypothetical protein